MAAKVEYRTCPAVTNEELNALFADASPAPHVDRDYSEILSRNLGHVCAYVGDSIIGYVNVAWDGALHAFLLDPTVRSDMRRRGIGTELVRRARELALEGGAEWLHVDYEPRLARFYEQCGFRKTQAGLMRLTQKK